MVTFVCLGLYEFCQLSCGGSVASAVKLNKQAADIFTKAFTSGEKWGALLRLISHVQPNVRFAVLPSGGDS